MDEQHTYSVHVHCVVIGKRVKQREMPKTNKHIKKKKTKKRSKNNK